MTTTQTQCTALHNGLAALAFSRGITEGLLEDIPDEKLTAEPCPNGNHAMWIAGHIAYADNGFRSKLSEEASVIPESWEKLFGMGSTPVAEASAYPPMSEIRAKMNESRTLLEQWFKGMSEEQLAQPLPGDWVQFAKTYGELMSNLASHEAVHAGQLTVVRRALGMKHRF